jgi:hypothetical protein
MPEVARKGGHDTIATNHGCTSVTHTDKGSDDVIVNFIGVVRHWDLSMVHVVPSGDSCVSHAVPLTTCSTTVFANFKGIGRKGDSYQGHTVTSGSPDVFAG